MFQGSVCLQSEVIESRDCGIKCPFDDGHETSVCYLLLRAGNLTSNVTGC